MKKLVQCATRCISKQSDRSNWIVIFMPTKNQTVQPNADLHFLPRIKRKRYVTITNSVLHCSCKKMERFGYPCHHLLHVMAVPSIHDIKSEWIHIRWFKKYLVEYCEPSIEEKVQIAKIHLLPKQIKEHGLKKGDVKISNAVLEKVVEGYTRESGVRGFLRDYRGFYERL